MMPSKPFFAFYGHHKCATMWWNRIFANACRKIGLRFQAVYDEKGFAGDLSGFIETQSIDFLSYGNAEIEHVDGLGNHQAVHIIRDPRDIAVSAYFSHLHSHSVTEWSELEEYREKLRQLSKDEGLATEFKNRATEFGHLRAWDYDRPNILEIRFEEIALTSYEIVLRAFRHFNLIDESDYRWTQRVRESFFEIIDRISGSTMSRMLRGVRPAKLSGAELLSIAWRFRFQSLAGGRKQGDEDVTSHYRKGRPGDWVNHFTDHHKNLFKELYPDLLIRLGYEASNDW